MDERKCVVRNRGRRGGQARTGDGDQGMDDVGMRIIV